MDDIQTVYDYRFDSDGVTLIKTTEHWMHIMKDTLLDKKVDEWFIPKEVFIHAYDFFVRR